METSSSSAANAEPTGTATTADGSTSMATATKDTRRDLVLATDTATASAADASLENYATTGGTTMMEMSDPGTVADTGHRTASAEPRTADTGQVIEQCAAGRY